MRTWFYASIHDETLDITIAEIEVELDVSVSINAGTVLTDITSVYVNGKCIDRGEPLTQQIVAIIRNQAESEINEGGDLWGRIVEGADLCLTGVAGDPDAKWRFAA